MIVHTRHGFTDTSTGEILDLSALARKPKGKPSKRLDSYPKRRTYAQRQLNETVALVLALSVIVSILTLAS